MTLSLADDKGTVLFTEVHHNAREGMSDRQYTNLLEQVVVAQIKAKEQGTPQYLIIIISPEEN